MVTAGEIIGGVGSTGLFESPNRHICTLKCSLTAPMLIRQITSHSDRPWKNLRRHVWYIASGDIKVI